MWSLPSFLTPTFLVLGLLAISLPVLFHFFRRTPRGEVRFSSLMFLQASPPRLTRRSRVDNWLLLILRGLVLVLIALAFGRIFFRQQDFLDISGLPSRRVAIVVDTSASMFRDRLWQQARQEFEKVVDELGPNDEVAVFAFDSELRTLVGFSADETAEQVSRRELVRGCLASLQPRWRPTNLGEALIQASEQLESEFEGDSADQITESRLVLISDFQEGSDIRALRSFEWPEEIPVDVITVESDSADNATLSLLENRKGLSDDASLRVKVTNAAESRQTRFELRWFDDGGKTAEVSGVAVVPPGQSRVVRVKVPDQPRSGLELSGDDHDFDNRFFLAYPEQVPRKVQFIGEEESVRNQLLFYLRKASAAVVGRRLTFSDESAFEEGNGTDILFVAGTLGKDQAAAVRRFCEAGGTVCIVATTEKMSSAVSTILAEPVEMQEVPDLDYLLLSEIDFSNRLFSPFSDPKFSNFSNIQFWKQRKVESETLKPIARFDNGNLAIGFTAIGEGRCYLFSSGWHPADSQFARSSKFVGVMMSMMLDRLERENLNLSLGEPVDFGTFVKGKSAILVTPEGDEIVLDAIDEPLQASEIDHPGIYQLSSGAQMKPLAFNLPASESQTDTMDRELLEQERVPLGTITTAAEKVEKERQRRDRELESRQKLWRWMLILALGILFLETWLSGYLARRSSREASAAQDS